MSFFKDLPMRDDAYLAWVRRQPSCISGDYTAWDMETGQGRNVAHHVVGGRHSTSKTSDYLAIPLTDAEHRELHDKGWTWWEEKYGHQWMHSAKTLTKAIAAGVFKFDAKAARLAA